jgi:exonuclease III/ribonuclease HI
MSSTPSTSSPVMSPSPIPGYATALLDNDTPTTHHPNMLNIGTINVQGGLAQGFFHSLCEQATLENIDIFGVQETNASPQQTKTLIFPDNNNILMYRALWASHKTHFRGSGVGIFIHNKWFKYIIGHWDDGQGRGIAVRFGFKAAAHFAIINCYLPNRQAHRVAFDTTEQWLRQQIDLFTQQGCHIILLGDFNGVVNPAQDRASPAHVSTTAELQLFSWLTNNSFIDTYRTIHPTGQLYTWKDASRLDMIWCDPTLAGYLHSTLSFSLVEPISSDHLFFAAIFTVRTLIQPSTTVKRGTYDRREKKILPGEATEEQWTSFSERIDGVLLQYGHLHHYGLPTPSSDEVTGGKWGAIDGVDLHQVDLDGLWKVLEDTIMSAAKYILPSRAVGGPPKAPHGINRMRAKTADIGRAIHRVEEFLIDPDTSTDCKATIYSEVEHWLFQNSEELHLPPLPEISADLGTWKEWTKAARLQWCASRAQHAAYEKEHRSNKILTAIDRRNLRFVTDTRATIRSILEVQSSRVQLDHLIVMDDQGVERILDDPQEVSAATLAYFQDTWHAPRIVHDLDEFWTKYYAPREDIDQAWFAHLMDPPTFEETTAAIGDSPSNKAPGPSGLTGDLLKHLGPLALSTFHVVLQACLAQAIIPSSWLRGMLYCIPKGACWSGRLADVRPLTLLEHGRKILFSILVKRLATILSAHSILSGVNFSVLPGTMTKDPIHILNAVMEDAREHNQEAWILFQDIRRCFDSVSCRPGQTMERSLRRLKVHRDFISLCTHIAENKSNVVITAFGHTDSYHPKCGLDQGGVECPLLWLICYDVLLAAVMDSGLGYVFMRRNSLVDQRRLPALLQVADEEPVHVPASAFVDDTNWYAPSKVNIEGILSIALAFFAMNAIEINPKKSELIVLNTAEHNPAVQVGDTLVTAHAPKVAARSLGVWFTGDGKSTATKALIVNETQTICSILHKRAITDKQTIFIVNNVLIPRLLYRMSVTILPPSTISEIVAKYTAVVREKVGLPAGTPNSVLYHRRLYGLRHLSDVQDEEQISTALLRFQDAGLVGRIMASRVLSLQAAAGLVEHPFSVPHMVSHIHANHFLAQVCVLMVARQICFNTVHQKTFPGQVLLSHILPPAAYQRVGQQLFKDGVLFLKDVTSDDGDTSLIPWGLLKTKLHLKGPLRAWYAALVHFLCNPAMDICDQSDTIEAGDTCIGPSEDPPLQFPACTESHAGYADSETAEDTVLFEMAMDSEDEDPSPIYFQAFNTPEAPTPNKGKGKQVIRETGMVLGDPFCEERSNARVDHSSSEDYSDEDLGQQGTKAITRRPKCHRALQQTKESHQGSAVSPLAPSVSFQHDTQTSPPPTQAASGLHLTFSSQLGPEADFRLQQDTDWLDQELAQRIERLESETTPQISKVTNSLQESMDACRQQYLKDVTRYKRSLKQTPDKLEQAVQGLARIAKEGMQKRQVHAQLSLDIILQKKQTLLDQQHAYAKAKHLDHLRAATARQQVLQDYIRQSLVENAKIEQQQARRMQSHMPPYVASIDPHIVHPITVQIGPPPTPWHAGHILSGPLWVPPGQDVVLARLQQVSITEAPRILYTDGSLINHGKPDCAMAFAVVDPLTDEEAPLLSGKVSGRASSEKAELMGVIVAVHGMPVAQDIIIRLDNQSVVTKFQELVINRHNILPRKRARVSHSHHWAILAAIVSSRTGTTSVEWIKGHTGDPGNEQADRAAKEAVAQDSLAWEIDISAQEELPFTALFINKTVEQDLRDLLKAQTAIRHHQSWSASKRVKHAIGDMETIDWQSTLSTIHDKKAVFTFFSSRRDSSQRSHHIKRLHGMLPTLSVMAARYPELYGQGLCCLCRQETEDNQHIWLCKNTHTAQQLVWSETIDKVNTWGRSAVAKVNAGSQSKQRTSAQQDPTGLPPPQLQWSPVSTTALWDSLSNVFHGLEHIAPAQAPQDPPPPELRPISDVYKGLLPIVLVNRWKTLFNTSNNVVTAVAHQFVRHLAGLAKTRLWKTRCEATVAWERTQNITRRQKRAPTGGNSSQWHNGSGMVCPEGYCRCGQLLTEHEEGQCPGPQDNPLAADQRLFNSIFGFYNLVLLEKRGRIPFY